MDRRQNEMERLMLEYEKQCLKDLQKSYTEALADVKQRLRVLLGRQEETPTTSIAYQVQFQRQLEEQLQNALDTLKRGNVTSVSDFLNKTYEDSYLGTIYGIQGQGIPINIGIDHEQMARTINRKTDTFKFSERLYKNVDELGVLYKSEMTRGIANGFTYSKIAKQLAMNTEANYKQAMRIVRTEGGRVKSEAKLNSMKAAKKEGADIVKQWDATFDGKTRAEHRFLDGQIKEIDEPFVDSQGREAQAPHKFGVASMDINCRCIVVERARWAVEGEEMPEKVDNVTGELVEGKNYKEWKNKYQKQQAEKQKEAMPNKAKVFDKNSKSLPSVNDYFKTTSGELVKIKEVNDYNGIKSVTLENGQNIVLGNVKEVKPFTPATNIEEAKDYMGKNFANSVYDVSLRNITNVDGFNAINETLTELQEKYPTDKLDFIYEIEKGKNWGAGAYNQLQVNPKAINNPERTMKNAMGEGWQAKLNKDLKEMQSYLGNPDYKQDIVQKNIDTIEDCLKFKRGNVIYKGAEIKSLITHEYGHILSDQKISLNSLDPLNWDEKQIVEGVKQTWQRAIESGDIYKISYYAKTKPQEFFAETFTIYNMGREELPSYIVEMLEGVIRYGTNK